MSRGKAKEIQNRIYCKRERLLNMLYTTGELSDELGISRDYISHSLILSGKVPCIKEPGGRVFINGKDVKAWIESVYETRKEKKSEKRLLDDEFFCVKCHRRKLPEEKIISDNNGHPVMIAYCPDCGTRMRKYIRKG